MTPQPNPTSDGKPWVCVPAVAWVLDDAPDVPASMVSTLLGFARHADNKGRNTFPSVETLVKYTRKSERQVRSDIKELRRLKLLTVAEDQSPAAHIRGDRRPTVYHLPLTGCSTPHAADDTPSGSRGAVQRPTGCSTTSNGVQPTAPEEDRTNPKNKEDARASSSSSPRPAKRARTPEEDEEARNTKIANRKRRDRTKARQKVMDRGEVDAELADAVLDYLIDNYSAGDLSRYVDGLDDDDLQKNIENATWEIEADRADERQYAQQADHLLGQIPKRFPDLDAQLAADIREAFMGARRSGHDLDAIYAAFNAVYKTADEPSYAFVDVLAGLSRQPAA